MIVNELENYDLQKRVPHLETPLELLDTTEYLTWLGTPECRVWHKIYRNVVRGRMFTKLNAKIYDEYYINGILAVHKPYREIAEALNLKSVGYISDMINGMLKKGALIIHKDTWNRRSITIYEVGTHDKSIYKYESLHMYNYLYKLNSENNLTRVNANLRV